MPGSTENLTGDAVLAALYAPPPYSNRGCGLPWCEKVRPPEWAPRDCNCQAH